MSTPRPSVASESFAAKGLWNCRGLWRLMRAFNLSGLLLSHGLSLTAEYTQALSRLHGRNKISDAMRSTLQEALKELFDICDAMALPASRLSVQKLYLVLDKENPDPEIIAALWTELSGRLQDETSGRTFFALSPSEAENFGQPRQGWEKIIDRFPQAAMDIEEANKCLALCRYAASVFHSVQITEVGIIALGKLVDVTDSRPGWTATAGKLKKIIDKKHQDRTVFEQANFAFIEQIQATVEALKNAWRNKISHTDGRLTLLTADFSPDVAEDILSATRAFMRRLATDAPWTSSGEQPS